MERRGEPYDSGCLLDVHAKVRGHPPVVKTRRERHRGALGAAAAAVSDSGHVLCAVAPMLNIRREMESKHRGPR